MRAAPSAVRRERNIGLTMPLPYGTGGIPSSESGEERGKARHPLADTGDTGLRSGVVADPSDADAGSSGADALD